MVIFHSYVNVYQRVSQVPMVLLLTFLAVDGMKEGSSFLSLVYAGDHPRLIWLVVEPYPSETYE